MALVIFTVVWLLAMASDTNQAAQPRTGSLAGRLVVATEKVTDPRFARSLIYIVRNDLSGALGLIVNRPSAEVPLGTLLEQFGTNGAGVGGRIHLLYGGRVERTRGVTLHTTDYTADGTVVVGEGVGLTEEPSILRAIGTGVGPRRAVVAFGYAGWAPRQLEEEVGAGYWQSVQAEEALLFDEDHETKWDRATARCTDGACATLSAASC